MKNKKFMPWLVLAFLFCFTGVVFACWKPVNEPGAFTFISEQAGAPLEGTFHDFDAEVCLDLDHPETNSHIEVTVNTASVDAMLPELDEALRGPDFFYSEKWPKATFVSDHIEALGNNHYKVTGKFTLRDITKTIVVPFDLKYSAESDSPRLVGNTTIKRLDYNIGLGEWKDTRWVANEVVLKFSVKLKAS